MMLYPLLILVKPIKKETRLSSARAITLLSCNNSGLCTYDLNSGLTVIVKVMFFLMYRLFVQMKHPFSQLNDPLDFLAQ